MSQQSNSRSCPDCNSVDRRDFLSTTAGLAVGAATAGALLSSSSASAAPTRNSKAEEAVKELYASLSEEQRDIVALPFDDRRRTKISANWHITKANVGSFTKPQQEIIHNVVRGITSEDGYERFIKQMEDDNGGINRYAIAIFGDPNGKQFEFELTGRHLTMRADGNTIDGPAFGGPIVYGHGKEGNPSDNLFFYQTKRANEVFQALDEPQRKEALLETAPRESAVQFRDKGAAFPGIAGSKLSSDQKKLVGDVIQDIMRPYREEDVKEVMKLVEAGGGIDRIHMSYYANKDLGGDGVWDVWRLEGPTLVCHFRGAPHVHAYINIAKRA